MSDSGANLTNPHFWDQYWQASPVLKEFLTINPLERSLLKKLRNVLGQPVGEIIEIGCAPGRWLAFFYREWGLKPSGIEWSDAGYQATVDNLRALKIDYGTIWKDDFLTAAPQKQFDYVLSLGFIEHFTDVPGVVARHLAWLKPGGTLILGMPNFRGLYGFFQARLDQSILDKHNLNIMNLRYLQQMADEFRLGTKFLGYVGPFDPVILTSRKFPDVTGPQMIIKAFLRIIKHIRNSEIFDDYAHHWISPYILGVFTNRNS